MEHSSENGFFSPPERTCLKVCELTDLIKRRVEDFPPVYVQGEVSNFTAAYASGHWYFTLKDSQSQIRVVMFKSSNERVKSFKPKDGMEIRVFGRLNVYKPRGEYNIICHSVEQAGQGLLQEQFEKLKQKLKAEGLFERKKPLPFLPMHIVIVSSPGGAAIRDILNILKRRFKGVQVTLIGALVQGEAAAESLREAVLKAQKLKSVDVLIITRGGGSMEDLWAFNDEALARQIFEFKGPVISAVGHEIDFTICDFVADLRAPTPSAAAELVVKNRQDLAEKTRQLTNSLKNSILNKLQSLSGQLRNLKQGISNPAKKLQDLGQYLDEISQRMKQGLFEHLRYRRQVLKNFQALLDSLSPLKVLDRGYALVSQNQKLIKDAAHLKTKQALHLRFAKGRASVQIKKIITHKGE